MILFFLMYFDLKKGQMTGQGFENTHIQKQIIRNGWIKTR
jgi:hypothetical protein